MKLAFCARGVLAVELRVFVEDIVFARNVMDVEPGLRDDAVGVVEFGWLGEMGDIAGMNDKGWLHAKRLDLADRFLERNRVRIFCGYANRRRRRVPVSGRQR